MPSHGFKQKYFLLFQAVRLFLPTLAHINQALRNSGILRSDTYSAEELLAKGNFKGKSEPEMLRSD